MKQSLQAFVLLVFLSFGTVSCNTTPKPIEQSPITYHPEPSTSESVMEFPTATTIVPEVEVIPTALPPEITIVSEVEVVPTALPPEIIENPSRWPGVLMVTQDAVDAFEGTVPFPDPDALNNALSTRYRVLIDHMLLPCVMGEYFALQCPSEEPIEVAPDSDETPGHPTTSGPVYDILLDEVFDVPLFVWIPGTGLVISPSKLAYAEGLPLSRVTYESDAFIASYTEDSETELITHRGEIIAEGRGKGGWIYWTALKQPVVVQKETSSDTAPVPLDWRSALATELGRYNYDAVSGEFKNPLFQGVAGKGTANETMIVVPRCVDYPEYGNLAVQWKGEGGNDAVADMLLLGLVKAQSTLNKFRDGCASESPCIAAINTDNAAAYAGSPNIVSSISKGSNRRPLLEEMPLDIGADFSRIILLWGKTRPGNKVIPEDRYMVIDLPEGEAIKVNNLAVQISSGMNSTESALVFTEKENPHRHVLVFVTRGQEPGYYLDPQGSVFGDSVNFLPSLQFFVPKKYLEDLVVGRSLGGSALSIQAMESIQYKSNDIHKAAEAYNAGTYLPLLEHYRNGTLSVE